MHSIKEDKITVVFDRITDALNWVHAWITWSWVEGFEPPVWARRLFLIFLPISWPLFLIVWLVGVFLALVSLLAVILFEMAFDFVMTMMGHRWK